MTVKRIIANGKKTDMYIDSNLAMYCTHKMTMIGGMPYGVENISVIVEIDGKETELFYLELEKRSDD